MILAEKIMSLRKQNGWSQEELAEKLDVTRQSVSKWESATSIPDLEKIIKLSQVFSVSTDYLLKDDEEIVNSNPSFEQEADTSIGNAKPISMEFASEFMDLTSSISKRFAFAVSRCVLSPIVLILLCAMSEEPNSCISEGFAVGVGLTVLFILVASGVLVFILDGMKLSKYEFLEKEPIKLMYGVEAAVLRRKEAFEPTFRVCIATGVVLCILSSIPVAISGAVGASDVFVVGMVAVLLVVVSIAVFLFVSTGMVQNSFSKLLQIEDYSVETKSTNKKNEKIYGVYWSLVTAGYLTWSFITFRWEFTWIVWPVAGVLFVPFKLLVDNLRKEN